MIINSIELPDPKDFTIDDVTGTTEETLLSGDRRYLKFDRIKKISFIFLALMIQLKVQLKL